MEILFFIVMTIFLAILLLFRSYSDSFDKYSLISFYQTVAFFAFYIFAFSYLLIYKQFYHKHIKSLSLEEKKEEINQKILEEYELYKKMPLLGILFLLFPVLTLVNILSDFQKEILVISGLILIVDIIIMTIFAIFLTHRYLQIRKKYK